MKQHTADILYKNKNIIKMSKADFILKATTLDDVEFTSKVVKTSPFAPRKTWAARQAQSAKAKAVNAVKRAGSESAEVASIDRPKRDYLDPFSQEGLAFHKDKSKSVCNFCKGAHWICKCPILWKRHRKGQEMPQDIKKILSLAPYELSQLIKLILRQRETLLRWPVRLRMADHPLHRTFIHTNTQS